MFSDWTDPYDIDNYYGGLHGLLKDIPQAPSSNMYQQMPVRPNVVSKPEPATAPIVNTPVDNVSDLKSTFEVKPMSIFLDGHPVGQQPPFNILKSGAPIPESANQQSQNIYTPKETYCNHNESFSTNWIYIIAFFTIMVLFGLLIQARCEITNMNSTIRMIVSMYSKRE